MCSLSPRLTNAATDSRIHIHSLSDVTEIKGPPGEFRVTIQHRPRYVSEKCVGCGECVPACPVKLKNEFDFGTSERTAIFRPFAGSVPSTFAIERKGWSPCKTACPVHTSAQGYVALVAEGRYDEAFNVAYEPNPFPSVCGRICTHVCETECTRGQVEEPIAVAGLKRFIADNGAPAEMPAAIPPVYDEQDRHRRRRSRRPFGGARAGPLRLRHDGLRGAAHGRRHAARRHPRVPPADPRAAEGRRPRAGARRRAADRQALRQRLHRRLAVRRRLQGRLPGARPAQEQGTAAARPRAGRRRARRRVPARLVAGREAHDRQACRGDRRRRRRLRRRPHQLPHRRRERHPGVHRRRAHRSRQPRRDRRGQGRAGRRAVRPHAGRDPRRRQQGDRRQVPALHAGRAQRARLASARRRSRASSSRSRPTRSSSPSARRWSTTS